MLMEAIELCYNFAAMSFHKDFVQLGCADTNPNTLFCLQEICFKDLIVAAESIGPGTMGH